MKRPDPRGILRRRVDRIARTLDRLSPLVGRRPWTIVAIAAGSTGAGLAEAGVLALIAYIAAEMSSGAETLPLSVGPFELRGGTGLLLWIAGMLAAIRLLLQIIVVRLPARLSGEVQSGIRRELFGAFLTASWSEKAKEKEGHLQELMGGQTVHAGNAVIQLGLGFSTALMFLALAASAFVLSAGVAVGVMATSALLFAGLHPLSRRVRRRSAETSAASISQATAVAESVRMAEEVQVFGAIGAERSRIGAQVASLERHYVRTRTLTAIVPVLYQSAVILLIVAGLALLYGIGTSQLAALGAVVLLLVRASSYGQRLLIAYQGLGESLPYLDRLSGAIERYRANARGPGTRPIGPVQSIALASVSFAYRPDTPVLTDISFSIGAGEAIGMVGPSGAGKTTLVQLLLRLREPSAGDYRVNDVPAGEIDDEVWYRMIAYLPQEPYIFGGTVAENIRFHREWLDDRAVERAARLAHIHTDITSWPDGYDTVVGQRADAVSGGQRQRLCLARALAGAPELLILDEPTSSLDPHSEHLIQRSLKDLRGELTLVVVAHRLTTLDLCDRVMVIRDGRLEAFAPAQSLYQSNGFYRHAADLAAPGGRM